MSKRRRKKIDLVEDPLPEVTGVAESVGGPEPGCSRAGWGADGCRAGWFFFGIDDHGIADCGVVPTVGDLVDRAGPDAPVFVDIPIGLRDSGDGERLCDVEGRRALSPVRGSSVFPTPARSAVYAGSYEEASRLNRARLGKGLSKQSWALAGKIREVDELLTSRPELRGRIREAHPEVCFWGLTGEPMRQSKRRRQGFRERIAALEHHIPEARRHVADAFLEHGGIEAQRDDIVDALVLALCALNAPDCSTFPAEPEVDPVGLRMEIAYWPRRLGPQSRAPDARKGR